MRYASILTILLLLARGAGAQPGNDAGARDAAGKRHVRPFPGNAQPPRIDPYFKISHRWHPGLGAQITGLGDVNGDGYGDFAVSSNLDTTYIFFGGPLLDEFSDGLVLGGGAALVAGDINGDGYTDLVTAQLDRNHTLDPDNRGLIRFYLHNHTSTPYDSLPNLQIAGRNPRSAFGRGGDTRLLGGDVNGDGMMDILAEGYNDATPVGSGIVYLYLGSPVPDTIPDFRFMDSHLGEMRRNFGEAFLAGDLNGDGCDDVVIESPGRSTMSCEVHLGNKDARFGAPYADVGPYGLNSGDFPWYLVDINGDNCPEIFSAAYYVTNPAFCWGKPGAEFQTQTFRYDTSFPNPMPGQYEFIRMNSAGRFGGSTFTDYIVSWGVPTSYSLVDYWIYQSGPGWRHDAVGYIRINAQSDGVYFPRPIGDVTGDGIDDVALICGEWGGSADSPVWIFRGDRQYRLSDAPGFATPGSPEITLYPNPVTAFDANRVSVRGMLEKPAPVEATVYDLLGRVRLEADRRFDGAGAFQIPIGVETLEAGEYFVRVRIAGKAAVKPLVKLSR